jgi:hypothetical protein
MKTKNADFVYKIFFIVVGVILAGLLIAWLVGTYKDKKQEADAGTQKINSVTSSMADFDMTVYDGASIKGESLIDLITELKNKGVQVSIGVKTLAKDTADYYNYEFSDNNLGGAEPTVIPPKDKAADGYITPTGNFVGDVIRNENDEIVCIEFTQQK